MLVFLSQDKKNVKPYPGSNVGPSDKNKNDPCSLNLQGNNACKGQSCQVLV